jgi:hypothetical protein
MKYFDENGRRIPTDGMRVFAKVPSHYYQISPQVIDYSRILDRSKKYGFSPAGVTAEEFKSRAEALLEKLRSSTAYGELLNGAHIPFVYKRDAVKIDLGEDLENNLLPGLKRSFNDRYPESHFKAILQSNSELKGNISLHPDSRYEQFVGASETSPVVGWYFPQALQEFDVESQRNQMKLLPAGEGFDLCLSGGMEMCAALAGSPELLINEDHYAPILCLSSYVHRDDRLVLLLKSYGPHMEFWCMTQMLTTDIKQVSEQWAGGISVYSET